MNAIFFTSRQLKKLQNCSLQKNIDHTESKLYIVENGEKWKYKKMILKYFYNNSGEYFKNKLLTINNLIESTSTLNIKALILPQKLAVAGGQIVGYIMPFIENINLLTLLQDFKINTQKKKEYLTQVGQIIDQVHELNKFQSELFIGDIHEANFIVGKEDDQVYVVDSDSFKTKNNLPFAAKYLATNPNILTMTHKYPINTGGIHIPNEDSDLLCYVFIILNTIARKEMQKVPVDEYYSYLDYLSSLGFGDDFIKTCGKIYTNAKNTSPLPYIEQIPNNIYQATYQVFKQRQYMSDNYRTK